MIISSLPQLVQDTRLFLDVRRPVAGLIPVALQSLQTLLDRMTINT